MSQQVWTRIPRFPEEIGDAWRRRMELSFVASVAVHGLALAIGLGQLAPIDLPPVPSLSVVLVNAKSDESPKDATLRAQTNLDGGGNTDADLTASTPLPGDIKAMRSQQEQEEAKVAELEREARELMTQIHSKVHTETKSIRQIHDTPEQGDASDHKLANDASSPTESSDGPTEALRAAELAKLEGQIEQEYREYQKRPRRKFIGGRAVEYVFAKYEDDYRSRVERLGTENYPAPVEGHALHGNVEVTVTIRNDGSIEAVQVTRSSGNDALDRAAVRIVKMAAPFPPFTDVMRKKTDILGITRTFHFTRAKSDFRAD